MINTIPKRDDPKFIIDWTRGVVIDKPEGSRHYLVSMTIAGRESPRDKYEVIYTIDSAASDGYVYLPSYADDDFGKWNMFQIARGVEGNWFRSTEEWDEVAMDQERSWRSCRYRTLARWHGTTGGVIYV